MQTFDTIVIGVGGVGSSALYHLARRGLAVLGIDQYPVGHQRGSSHGRTRVIRQAYFEHPDYVPLLLEAYRLWKELETETNRHLLHQVGLIEVGPADGVVLPGVQSSAEQHGVDVEPIERRAFAKRFPGLVLPPSSEAVFEPEAGYLMVEDCLLAHVEAAIRHGAQLNTNEIVLDWQAEGGGFRVTTSKGNYECGGLIVCAGAWSSRLLRHLKLPLRILRKPLHWFANTSPCYGAAGQFPTFFYETSHGYFYGFPQIDRFGVKVAQHSGGRAVTDPDRTVALVDTEESRQVERFLSNHLPRLSLRRTRYETCLYTMTMDEHFVIDLHPNWPGLAFVAGLSGHGFKFTSVLGHVVAQLLIEGKSDHPAGFLSLARFDHKTPSTR